MNKETTIFLIYMLKKKGKRLGTSKRLAFGSRLTVKGWVVGEWSEMGVGGNRGALELRHQACHPPDSPLLLLPLPLLLFFRYRLREIM